MSLKTEKMEITVTKTSKRKNKEYGLIRFGKNNSFGNGWKIRIGTNNKVMASNHYNIDGLNALNVYLIRDCVKSDKLTKQKEDELKNKKEEKVSRRFKEVV